MFYCSTHTHTHCLLEQQHTRGMFSQRSSCRSPTLTALNSHTSVFSLDWKRNLVWCERRADPILSRALSLSQRNTSSRSVRAITSGPAHPPIVEEQASHCFSAARLPRHCSRFHASLRLSLSLTFMLRVSFIPNRIIPRSPWRHVAREIVITLKIRFTACWVKHVKPGYSGDTELGSREMPDKEKGNLGFADSRDINPEPCAEPRLSFLKGCNAEGRCTL